jgi:hypothetical protein
MSERGRTLGALALVIIALAVGGLKFFGSRTPPPGVTLTDLRSIGQLQTLFNDGKGTPRLVLILSPT